MEWFFDGLGTLLIGLVIGGAGGGVAGWKLAGHRLTQTQSGGDKSVQTQVGGDQLIEKTK